MVRCAERFPRLGMALSLHSARQEQRESLIPLARRYPLEVLRKAMEQVTSIQRQPLMVEYLLLEGLNDTDEDLSELIAYLRGLRVHINLIPYNAIPEDAGLIGTAAGTAALVRRGPDPRRVSPSPSATRWGPTSRQRVANLCDSKQPAKKGFESVRKKRGQAPLPERHKGCFAQRCLTPFFPNALRESKASSGMLFISSPGSTAARWDRPPCGRR